MTGILYSNNGNQWDTESENTLITTTPAIIKASPNTAGQSRCCLNTVKPMTAISTIPTPDQMAYAMPTGMCFSTKLRQ